MSDKTKLLLKKIKEDRPFYLEKFLKIRNKEAKLIPFKINDAQEMFEEEIKKCEEKGILKRFIVLKARQMGFSTYSEGYIFHNTTTNTFTNSMIIAHEEKATQNLFNMSKLYYDELPVPLKPMIKYSNGKELVFENPTNDPHEKKNNPGLRSKITVSTAGTVEVGRSATVHNLHASEVAFFPDAGTTMLGLLQCVPDTPNSCVILESTANGVGGYFYDMWQKACRGENDFIPLFYPWFTDRSYTTPFKDEQAKEIFEQSLSDYEVNLMKTNNLTLEQIKDLLYAFGGDPHRGAFLHAVRYRTGKGICRRQEYDRSLRCGVHGHRRRPERGGDDVCRRGYRRDAGGDGLLQLPRRVDPGPRRLYPVCGRSGHVHRGRGTVVRHGERLL